MDVRVEPEPTPEERAAILLALDEAGGHEAEAPPAWGRSELDGEPEP